MECFAPVPLWSQGIMVPCGHCPACLANRQQDWATRLLAEMQNSENAYFVTLTYNDDSLPHDPTTGLPCVYSDHITKLNKDIRKRKQVGKFRCSVPYSNKRIELKLSSDRIRYYITSEYGPEHLRPHYHCIYFNVDNDIYTVECLFREVWKHGFIDVAPCSIETIMYTTKYLIENKLCPDLPPGIVPPFSRMSKGLGACALTPNLLDFWRNSPSNRVYMPVVGGQKKRLSRYLKDKIFDDDMKESIREKYQDLHPARKLSFRELCDLTQRREEYERQRVNRLKSKSKIK